MEAYMHITTIHLSALLAPKANPRKSVDPEAITRLAQSIREDGVLQNLVVRPEGEAKFRVVAGKRRYLALQHLKKEGAIDGSYDVPVEVRDDLTDDDALRLATVENAQREQLHVLDEAEAFAKLLQSGGTIEAIVEKTGLAPLTVKRWVALAGLCPEAKKALRAGTIGRSVAEALTLASHGQQRQILKSEGPEGLPGAEELRDHLLNQKPSVALAIFPVERYEGNLTTDLFADESTTYFDDVDQFLVLQKEAVDRLADEHRRKAGFVDVLEAYSAPWWHYREAEEGEASGTVIHLHPSGAVEVRENLVRRPVVEAVAKATQDAPAAPRERPAFTERLLRYAAYHRTAAVQAALLRDSRKAKEVAALLLLRSDKVELGVHDCHRDAHDLAEMPAGRALEEASAALADRLGLRNREGRRRQGGIGRLLYGDADGDLHEAVGKLPDEELDRLLVLLPVLCFGQERAGRLDAEPDRFNRVAGELRITMRDWWTPDVAFLGLLRRDQLSAVAEASGAAERLGSVSGWSKVELVQALARHFATGADLESEASRKGRQWLPGPMRFPASDDLGS
jgi:ParB family chromosome partitioning protein